MTYNCWSIGIHREISPDKVHSNYATKHTKERPIAAKKKERKKLKTIL
jgi:hypothetical protein